ncbi:MAG: hypothetical protein F2650_06760 [Actinobacteria bacterium]|uniref:Unannotated protein n=1 Tax=freshwater metagenome TaxID=449393 RepID=A0A6J6NCP6_9ZZZZ|nr:hypothetical protein [Actinomycetota bacterium]
MKLGRKIAIGVVATLALSSTTAGVSHAATSITGSGSTFIKNLFDACAPNFNDLRTDGTTVSYSGGGSGAGRTAFTGGTTNFAGTDSTYGSTDTPPADFTYVPIIAGPVSIMFKHSGYSGTLKLTAETVAKIFAGTITDWADAAITTDNGSALPTKTIKVIYRSDSSGTSAGFTAYLKAAAPTTWTKAGSSTFTSSAPSGAPAGSAGKSGSDGVTNFLSATDGGISYAELSYQLEASADGVKSAYIKNASGAFIKPSSAASAAAASAIPAANFDATTGWIAPDYVSTVATAYPITIFSFGIAHKSYSEANDVVKDFLSYSLNSCAEAQASSLGYAKLTSTALTFAKARVALVSSVDRPVTATTTTVAPALKASVKVGKTITAKTVALGGKLTVAKTAKVTLRVTSGGTVCKVVGATLKGLKKGTCKVLASVKTGTKTKTATVTVTVS